MALQLELQRLPREVQRPFQQIATKFPLGPQDLAEDSVGADQMADLTWSTVSYGTNWRRLSNLAALEVQAMVSAEGIVLVRGVIERTTAGYALPVTLCTLPAGHRPGRDVFRWAMRTNGANTGFVRINIQTDGDIVVDADATAHAEANGDIIYLDDIVFSTVA